MNEVETQAHELLRRKEWSSALGLYDQLLGYAAVKGSSKERLVSYLLGRSECCLELGRHEAVVSDCRKIIKLLGGAESSNNCGARARRRLVHALFTLRRFAEAEAAAAEWIASSGGMTSTNPEAVKMLERVRIGLQMANGQKNMAVKGSTLAMQLPRLEDDILGMDYNALFNPSLDERQRRNRKHPVELIAENPIDQGMPNPNEFQQAMMSVNHMPIDMNNMAIIEQMRLNCVQPPMDQMTALRLSEEMKSMPVTLHAAHQQQQMQQHFQQQQLQHLQHQQQLQQQQQQLQQQQLQQQLQQQQQQQHLVQASVPSGFCCTYCCLTFATRIDLRTHCQTESHQRVIMSDEGRDWKWRPPPRGYTSENYTVCESWVDSGVCRYGAQCVEAHGAQELQEWRERFEYRRMKLQRASEKELYGKSYTEQLLEKWVQSASPDRVMREHIDEVKDNCDEELVTSVSSKTSQREWTFTLHASLPLRAVALLQDTHRNHFTLRRIHSSAQGKTLVDCDLSAGGGGGGQEWVGGVEDWRGEDQLEHTVTVAFCTDIYGTFRQSLVVDFGTEPVLVKHLCVDVIPVTNADKINDIKKELVLSSAERWDNTNATIIPFSSPNVPAMTSGDSEREQELLASYPMPRSDTFTLTQSTISEKKLTRNNYRARMHELLCVEEMARYEQVARYNLSTRLKLVNCYLLSPSVVAASTAKYSHDGELFALMSLGKDISEDTSAGRLILNNCTTVLLSPPKKDKSESQTSSEKGEEKPKRVVHEALIEDKGKNVIYLRISSASSAALELKNDMEFTVEVQFQLNRVPYCEWHHAIDKIADFRVVFPETYLEPNIPWTPQRQWSETLDSKLNLKQKEAVVAITTPVDIPLPPILIIGPFGTGKTYTLAQAIKEVLLQANTRVLVCTHSNSAADLYIKDYLHPYVEAGHEEARPLRIYYHKRWVATVNQTVQKYCLIDESNGVKTFKQATLQDIVKHRVIVVTLSISMSLSSIGLNKGHFSHILLDEAAQAMECEAIMPLALANEDTRIVLAGDHMQLSPELFSQFAKERHLHVSLLERLYDHYPATFPCKILLCENYRAHEAIIQFTSELFYDQKLISSGKQPRHEKFYPLTFFTTRGEDVQDHNSTAFYNNSEVYEVVERVCELKKRWPAAWGRLDEHSIGIMTPYADQVFRIRSELRKRRMGGISVERVLNVQGKQFRAIFLSTVRTRRTCDAQGKVDEMDYGFLSNSKLLNTAITRAQSLVAVVGDPVALCSIGRCRKVWERFIEICNGNDSLYGIKWSYLRSLLDGVELKKTYTLNPLAPEFVPRQFQTETYIRLPQVMSTYNGINGITPGMRFVAPYIAPNTIYPVPAPAAYFPSYQPPPNSFYSIRPGAAPVYPPAAAATVATTSAAPQLNAWGLNYPQMVSPNNANGFPNNAWIKKKQDSPPLRREEIRPPPGIVPQQRPAYSQIQQLSQIQRPSPVSPNQVMDGFLNQNGYLRSASQPSTFISPPLQNQAALKLPAHVIEQQRRIVQPQNGFDKDQIQFLHNVHFPERQALGMNGVTISNLLPGDVNLADLAESQQLEWYTHLLDTLGMDTANKFMEAMTVPRKATPLISEIQSVDDMFLDKYNGHQMSNGHLPPTQMVETVIAQQQPQRPHTWYLSESVAKEALQQQQPPQPQIAQVLELSPAAALQHHQQQQQQLVALQKLQQQQQQQQQQQLITQQILAAESRFNPPNNWEGGVSNSVPLYRRQAQSQPQPEPHTHNRLMEEKAMNGTSGAFAGYARAAISLQSRDNHNHFQDDGGDELLANIQRTTTYASVLRTHGNKHESNSPVEEKGDPFAVLRDLGNKSTSSGLYHYFS